jgi:hypothetical protein
MFSDNTFTFGGYIVGMALITVIIVIPLVLMGFKSKNFFRKAPSAVQPFQ